MPRRSPPMFWFRCGFPCLIFCGERLRPCDITLLDLLRAATKKVDQSIAVLHQIDSVAWPPIDPVLADCPHPPHVRCVAHLESRRRCSDLRGRLRVKAIEPGPVWIGTVLPNILNDGAHRPLNVTIYVTG